MGIDFLGLFKKKVVTDTKEKRIGRIVTRKEIGGYAAHAGMEAIFKGEDQSYTLSVGSYNKQISMVARLVGVPLIAGTKHQKLQTLLFDEGAIITLRALINGTHWVLPRLLKNNSIGLEHIRDSAIGSGGLQLDPDTGELKAVVIHEQVQWLDDQDFYSNLLSYAERRRRYTRDTISEVWTGSLNKRVDRKNTLGLLPIPFAFMSLGDLRGTSAYAGVLRLLRDIHEVRRNRDEILALFSPKAAISTDDWDTWVKRNMIANSQSDLYDPYSSNVVTNTPQETFSFLSLPSGVVSDHNAALEDNSKEQLISSPLPEMFNGKALTGNYAMSEYQQQQGIQFVQSVRNEMLKAWKQLVAGLVELENYLTFKDNPIPEISWDNLELSSPLTQSQILLNCVNALSLMVSGNIPVEVAFSTIKRLQPLMPYETPGELMEGVKKLKADTVPDEDFLSGGIPSWGG